MTNTRIWPGNPILIAWYRPPGSVMNLFDKFESILAKMDNENKYIIVLGDLNCDLLACPASCYTMRLTEICDTFALVQVIN